MKRTTYEYENDGAGDNPLYRDVFEVLEGESVIAESTGAALRPGWYWIPSAMSYFDPTGPFLSEAAAIADAAP